MHVSYLYVFFGKMSIQIFYLIFFFDILKNIELYESEKVKVLVTQSCPTLRDPIDCSLQGSSVHGIL